MERLTLLNVGNTHVQMRRGELLKNIPTPEFTAAMIPPGPCAAASVVPQVTEKVKAARNDVFWITAATPGIPDLSRVEGAKLGADRIANASKLLLDGRLPAMTIDCGTAIDCEIVSADGVYCGGAILPGRGLVRRALNLCTALLPEIPMEETLPAEFPGRGTQSDLRWGTDGALLAAVLDLVKRTRALFPGEQLRIVFCGGDGRFFARYCPGAEYGGDDFTLSGIEALYTCSHRS